MPVRRSRASLRSEAPVMSCPATTTVPRVTGSVLIVGHAATRYALDHLCGGVPLAG